MAATLAGQWCVEACCGRCRGRRGDEAGENGTFAALDPSRTGLIDKQALLLHLLAAGDDPDAVSLLFSALGAKDGATVSAREWAEGVARYNGAGYRDAQVRCGVCRAASGRFKA